jgi:hypothetical protein
MAMVFVAGAGCTAPSGTINARENATAAPGTIAASYVATINQPNAQSGYLKMDTDIYNAGEVVGFTVTNDGSETLACAGNPPSFSVQFQAGNGLWATRMGTGEPNASETSSLAPGASTQVYRFVTTGWDPARYRIVHDCGVEREFLVRALPAATPAPVACPADTVTVTPWITISPPGDLYAARSFTLHGTTNLPAGQELFFTIFSVVDEDPDQAAGDEELFTTPVEEGSCGTNTWSATGEIQATGEFFIWISDAGRNTTAIKRFTVYPE